MGVRKVDISEPVGFSISLDDSQLCRSVRTCVDREVKYWKEGLQLPLLLRKLELVSTKGRDARFDATRTHSDEEEANQREFTMMIDLFVTALF